MFRKMAIVLLSFLALATLTIGVTSYAFPLGRRFGRIPDHPMQGYQVGAVGGRLFLHYAVPMPQDRSWSSRVHRFAGFAVGLAPGKVKGSAYSAYLDDKLTIEWEYLEYFVFLPLWMPFVLFAPYPAFVLARLLRKRTPAWRRRHGLCARCGYDLTGNTSGVCPECGRAARQG
jgi:hypothetical protein